MATIPEQIEAVLHDVQAVLDENVRLNAALAKCNAELFEVRKRLTGETYVKMAEYDPATKTVTSTTGQPARTVTLKAPSTQYDVVKFERKDASLENDVKRFLGIPPFQNDPQRNNGKFIMQLDREYGHSNVNAMIAKLRQV